MTSERQAYVHIQLPDTFETVPAALLKVEKLDDGTYVGRFRYGDRYLERPNAIALDPFKLPLGSTVHEFTKLKGIPGAVRDAGPDAWGRRVIEHKLERGSADLEELDYLLNGPQDGAGYLSFSLDRTLKTRNRPFNRTHQLPTLIKTAHDIEEGKRVPVHILEQLEPGTSMGGARPKATIEEGDQLWIGKFPEKGDPFSLQRVEYATLELARRCGINVTRAKIVSIGGFDVLMVERFDREHSKEGYMRLGLVSGLTLLDGDENYLNRERWSYPLLADQVRRWSIRPDEDRKELFRRMVFNAAVTNNDDHPRNHAMLRKAKGWELTPGYDLVPAPVTSLERRDLAMTIGEFGRTASIYNLLSHSARFGFGIDGARTQIDSVVAAVKNWRDVFGELGVAAKDIEYIAPAFLPECFFFERPVQQA